MPTSNATNVARACRACLAGLALVILPASLAEATFGPRTKIGTNYQQWSNTTSVGGSTEASCSGFAHCHVLFQPALAQKPLIVQHVSCSLFVSAGSLQYGSLWTRKGQDFPLRRTPLVPVPTTGGWWVVNSPVMHLIQSGERPQVLFVGIADANWSPECTISGTLQ